MNNQPPITDDIEKDARELVDYYISRDYDAHEMIFLSSTMLSCALLRVEVNRTKRIAILRTVLEGVITTLDETLRNLKEINEKTDKKRSSRRR